METSLHSGGLWVSSCLSQVSLKYWDYRGKKQFHFFITYGLLIAFLIITVFKAQQFPKDLKSMCQKNNHYF